MASRLQLRGGTLAQWATANPILADREPGYEKDTGRLKIGDGSTVWNSLPYAYSFITLTDGDETHAGIFEEATDAETIAGTAIGGTGRHLVITPAKLKTVYNLSPIACAPSAGTLSLDCQNRQEAKFICSTVSTPISIVLSNATNLIILHLTIPITGTGIALTWPSTTRMDRLQEVVSGDGWIQATKVLTVSSVAAADLWEFSLMKAGSVNWLRHGGPARA